MAQAQGSMKAHEACSSRLVVDHTSDLGANSGTGGETIENFELRGSDPKLERCKGGAELLMDVPSDGDQFQQRVRGMPQERLPMRKIREVLSLKAEGFSKRRIAASLGISATAAMECVQRARRAGLRWPLPEDMSAGANTSHS
jgi:hypothetical protein